MSMTVALRVAAGFVFARWAAAGLAETRISEGELAMARRAGLAVVHAVAATLEDIQRHGSFSSNIKSRNHHACLLQR